jgi:serine acetyltransferase
MAYSTIILFTFLCVLAMDVFNQISSLIGRRSVIGAMSVVSKDVLADSIAVGCPARFQSSLGE